MDTNVLMMTSEPIYDVIDLDPYESVIPFIDSAIKVNHNNTLICTICTDLIVLDIISGIELKDSKDRCNECQSSYILTTEY